MKEIFIMVGAFGGCVFLILMIAMSVLAVMAKGDKL